MNLSLSLSLQSEGVADPAHPAAGFPEKRQLPVATSHFFMLCFPPSFSTNLQCKLKADTNIGIRLAVAAEIPNSRHGKLCGLTSAHVASDGISHLTPQYWWLLKAGSEPKVCSHLLALLRQKQEFEHYFLISCVRKRSSVWHQKAVLVCVIL